MGANELLSFATQSFMNTAKRSAVLASGALPARTTPTLRYVSEIVKNGIYRICKCVGSDIEKHRLNLGDSNEQHLQTVCLSVLCDKHCACVSTLAPWTQH